MKKTLYIALWASALIACEEPFPEEPENSVEQPDAAYDVGVSADAGTTDEDMGGVGGVFENAQVVFDFGDWTIPPGGEEYPCAQWTLNNEKPLYVNAVTQANDGGFHHSNWYAVPVDRFEGDDGIFPCEERGFTEATAAVLGEVVFAQSTQAYVEEQEFPENVVIKIPPNSKIMGGLHLLNISGSEMETGVRMGLELVHPRDVETIVTPWRMDISALRIPPGVEKRVKADCDLSTQYERKAEGPFEPVIYWALPHYHELGNYFRVDLIRPDGDETILELAGFNAEANGITFETPIDVAGATGMRLVCGYQNPYDYTVTYGLEGDDEMCTLLAFTDAEFRLNTQGFQLEGSDMSEGMPTDVADCGALFIQKNSGQEMPTDEELEADLYVPESNAGDEVALVPDCADVPDDAEPDGPSTMTSIRSDVLRASCAYSSCHDADSPAAGLDFTADDLHAELMGHTVAADVDMPLVTPGDPDQSWLYRIMSSCEPETNSGVAAAMPRNSPTLLPPEQVARVRAWIESGALDD